MNALYEKAAASPELAARVAVANKALTAVGYVAYPLLLALLWAFSPQLLARCIVVPAAGFVVLSVFRRLYDAPRPYENGGPAALVPKATQGRSFPSRHTFCMFTIAFAWMTWQPAFAPALGPVVGALLFAGAVVMAASRVTLGVHHPRDVVAGALAAGAFSALGYLAFPW